MIPIFLDSLIKKCLFKCLCDKFECATGILEKEGKSDAWNLPRLWNGLHKVSCCWFISRDLSLADYYCKLLETEV